MHIFSEIELFNKYKSTIRDTSFDDNNNKRLIDSNRECIDFDKVKEKYTKELNKIIDMPSSVDAVILLENKFLFVEFKNENLRPDKNFPILKKAKDSFLIFGDITESKIKYIRENSIFILVYSKEKNSEKNKTSRRSILKDLSNKANKEAILFGMDKLIGLYFERVITMDDEEFLQILENEEDLESFFFK